MLYPWCDVCRLGLITYEYVKWFIEYSDISHFTTNSHSPSCVLPSYCQLGFHRQLHAPAKGWEFGVMLGQPQRLALHFTPTPSRPKLLIWITLDPGWSIAYHIHIYIYMYVYTYTYIYICVYICISLYRYRCKWFSSETTWNKTHSLCGSWFQTSE